MAQCKVDGVALRAEMETLHHPLAELVIDVDVGARHTPTIHQAVNHAHLAEHQAADQERGVVGRGDDVLIALSGLEPTAEVVGRHLHCEVEPIYL